VPEGSYGADSDYRNSMGLLRHEQLFLNLGVDEFEGGSDGTDVFEFVFANFDVESLL